MHSFINSEMLNGTSITLYQWKLLEIYKVAISGNSYSNAHSAGLILIWNDYISILGTFCTNQVHVMFELIYIMKLILNTEAF